MYQHADRALLGGMVARAFSLRVIFLSLVVGVCAYVLVQLAWSGVGFWLMWLVAAGTYALAVWGGGSGEGQMVKCDACGKRVKMGSERCHHCGYSRVQA